MIKILVADDEPQKISDVISFLSSKLDAEFVKSNCFDSTIEQIMEDDFDLIILDMSLPTFTGVKGEAGRMRALGGRDILEIMEYEERKIPVIVFTQFDVFGRSKDIVSLQDVHLDLSKSFSDFYLGSVMYDSRYEKWKVDLSELILKRF